MLHYIYDPLCGWCYGTAPLIKAAAIIVPVRIHGGGMMTGPRRQSVTPSLYKFLSQHDSNIQAMSGQHFDKAYSEGLLRDGTTILDSAPPTTAILTADHMRGQGLEMLSAIQSSHYEKGERIADRSVLIGIAESLGFDSLGFSTQFDNLSGAATTDHIKRTRNLMRELGAMGFPTLALETKHGIQIIDILAFMGRTNNFQDFLIDQINSIHSADISTHVASSIDGCASNAGSR